MPFRDWLRPPRHLIALFLVLTLVPSLLLVAFGWRLLRQDLELERQQQEAAREQAADVIVAALDQGVAAVETAMRDTGSLDALAGQDDAVVVVFTRGGVRAFPSSRLLFAPIASPGREAPASIFAGGEALEFRGNDPVRAAAWFRDLARSPSESIRAGALIRLARNQRKTRASAAALDTYARVSAAGAAVGGVPADLLARWARCDLLAAIGRDADLQHEARLLAADLLRGRWQLDRAQFSLHFEDAARWAGGGVDPAPLDAVALATSVEWLYQQWRLAPDGKPFSGRAARTTDGILHTLLWQGTGEQGVAFVGGPRHLASHWTARLAPLHERHGVGMTLADPAVRAASTSVRRRTAAETGLPWTVLIDATGDMEAGAFTGRRAVWLAGLGIIALLIVSGTYVVVRAVSRELAVARLQSDFVSAVSHEFRTPLTSLRQLSEMLSERPSMPIEQRQTYYAALARQTGRLHRLVESLLDFGRMEAGTSPYRLAPLDACVLIADVVQQFAADPAARGYDVRLHVTAAAGAISGDRDALTNALWNLLDNAVKYSPASRAVWVDVAADGSTLSIAVRDRGLGIPAAEQREIFGKFVRGATARDGNIGGTGIGLAMVSHIVAAHGGAVSVVSGAGEGSTFTIRLPLIPSAAVAESEAACLES